MSKITSTGPSAPLQPIAEVESPRPTESAHPQESSKANAGALDLLNSPGAQATDVQPFALSPNFLGDGPIVLKITDKFGEFKTRTVDTEAGPFQRAEEPRKRVTDSESGPFRHVEEPKQRVTDSETVVRHFKSDAESGTTVTLEMATRLRTVEQDLSATKAGWFHGANTSSPAVPEDQTKSDVAGATDAVKP